VLQWEEEVIASILGVKGRLLHAAVGVSVEDWEYTDLDLQAIAPPLTRICNRYEPIARYAKYGDPVVLGTALAAYATRSLLERKAELDAQEEAPINGDQEQVAPAPAAPSPGTAPRVAASFPTAAPGAPPPPAQPSEGPAPVGPPRPAEADIDPTKLTWEVDA
jgi:hypothetical protein